MRKQSVGALVCQHIYISAWQTLPRDCPPSEAIEGHVFDFILLLLTDCLVDNNNDRQL